MAGRTPRAAPAEVRARRLDEILDRLRAAGERITVARRAVVSALLAADGRPRNMKPKRELATV